MYKKIYIILIFLILSLLIFFMFKFDSNLEHKILGIQNLFSFYKDIKIDGIEIKRGDNFLVKQVGKTCDTDILLYGVIPIGNIEKCMNGFGIELVDIKLNKANIMIKRLDSNIVRFFLRGVNQLRIKNPKQVNQIIVNNNNILMVQEENDSNRMYYYINGTQIVISADTRYDLSDFLKGIYKINRVRPTAVPLSSE